MYEKDPETGELDFSHNPVLDAAGRARGAGARPIRWMCWDISTISSATAWSCRSGAVRNHKPEIMYEAFRIVGYDGNYVDAHFGGMLSAFRYGAPPHAGIAPGIDRIVMLLAGAENIREVIMFPMNQRAEDLMMGAPSEPTLEQLRELGIRVVARA